MRKLSWHLIPIVIFLVLGIFLWRGLSLDPHHLPSVQIGKKLPAFSLPQLGQSNNTLSFKNFNGRVVLLNVWASWCQACAEEQAFLMQLAKEGVVIYGLNYKDAREDALLWLKTWGNPYKIIGQDLEGKTAIDLGVYGAPETFVVDKKSIIRFRYVGPLKEEVWLKQIRPLLKKLEAQP